MSTGQVYGILENQVNKMKAVGVMVLTVKTDIDDFLIIHKTKVFMLTAMLRIDTEQSYYNTLLIDDYYIHIVKLAEQKGMSGLTSTAKQWSLFVIGENLKADMQLKGIESTAMLKKAEYSIDARTH